MPNIPYQYENDLSSTTHFEHEVLTTHKPRVIFCSQGPCDDNPNSVPQIAVEEPELPTCHVPRPQPTPGDQYLTQW